MRRLTEECAAMAAEMLDAELLAIARRAAVLGSSTPLQKAVSDEIVRRNISHHGGSQAYG